MPPVALALYSLLTRLVQPLLRRKLARRALAEPGYGVAVPERFGHYSHPPVNGVLWLHAVSLGETRAAAVLLDALRQRCPDLRLLLTHGTATGRAEGAKLLRPGDLQVWQPWDTPEAVDRLLAHHRPRLGVLMETEVWPNAVAACRRLGVPLVLANARLNDASWRRARRLRSLSGPAYAGLHAVYAQSDADAARLRDLGAPVAAVLGNLKFDARPDPDQCAQGAAWRGQQTRPVVTLASAREGEEMALVVALKAFLGSFPAPAPVNPGEDATDSGANDSTRTRSEPLPGPAPRLPVQWLVVPRHPQRFDAVASLLQAEGFSVSRRSAWGTGPAAADVWLGDSLGEMALYYSLSDVALLGGSFEPLGGQNLIEAIACGCPVVMGPSVYNFQAAADAALATGAALATVSMQDAVQAVLGQQGLVSAPGPWAARRAAACRWGSTQGGTAAATADRLAVLWASACAQAGAVSSTAGR